MATKEQMETAKEEIRRVQGNFTRTSPAIPARVQGEGAMKVEHGASREREQYVEVRHPEEARPTPAQQRARRENIEKAQEARRYENRTKRDLYERAKELSIEGRSKMSKQELITALRERR
ncbi:MAG TPA: Rho termination factor N-terminal domain-containing protein [Methanomicrobiales archaeon]|nr:Rho termination factor N-terminal domain-containing protein [Methanomicrobiales archaeon]